MATKLTAALVALIVLSATVLVRAQSQGAVVPLSPAAMVASRDGQSLWIACATSKEVIQFQRASGKVVRRAALPGEPSGLALSKDGARLYVTCPSVISQVAVVDTEGGGVIDTLTAGHTSAAPVLSPDGKLLYVANRFNNNISILDLASRRELRRIAVVREPVAAAVTQDGSRLLVGNHLPAGRADVDYVAATISVLDLVTGKQERTLQLPNGAGSVMDVRISPDGRYAAVAHVLSRHQLPTTQLERGWMNTNAITLIDVQALSVINTFLLDGPLDGAANPWAIAWTEDGSKLIVTHAGAHEVSITDVPGLLEKHALVPLRKTPGATEIVVSASETRADVPNDLSFLTGLRQTVTLPEGDRGPRGVAVVEGRIYTANYFSDTLSVIELAALRNQPQSIPLGPKPQPGLLRQGEEHFHDASLCMQHWQSCATCHPGNARVDGFNWDLLNDGIGNPKNTKSMLLSHKTPPAMSLGVRETAETAVRSGFLHIQYTRPPGSVTAAVDAYLNSLKPVPSPYLVNGELSAPAKRGREIFMSKAVGCAVCHPAGLLTDMQPYDVGTASRGDKPGEKFDTPTLVEVWRTAPYLHDGSAATMRDVFTIRNRKDRHGKTSHLTPRQLDDLVEYILSL